MDPGDKCICQSSDWYNAFGCRYTKLIVGERLIVRDSKMISGTRFYSFREHDEDQFFMSEGFKPLRSLN